MKKITLLFLTLLTSAIGLAQTQTYNNIKRVKVNNVDAILENKQVVGYYVFYYKDKVSKKEAAYELSLMDANLTPTHTIELIKDRDCYLLEGSYNGTNFCFSFLNMKKKNIEYQIIDKKAKIVGSYFVEELSNAEIHMYAAALQTEEDTYEGSLIGIEGQGFVRYGMEKKGGTRYEIELIDNNAKKVWSINSGATSKKSYESTQSFYSDKNTVVTVVSTREKLFSTEGEYYLLFTSVADGKELFKVNVEHTKGYLIPMGINYDEAKKTFLVYGEYYGKKGSKDKFDPENKLGFFMIAIDYTGKVIEEHFVDWQTDISKLIPLNKKGRMEGNLSVYIHSLVKTADGKYFIIGEQFKKTASALGIIGAGNSNSNVSMVKVNLRDMMVFEFNSSFNPVKVHIIEKDETKILLPKGAGSLSTNQLGRYLKMTRGFDYAFTFIGDGNKTFYSSYVNYDKEKGESSKYVIGNIVYNKQGELVTDQIPLSSKPTFFSVLPGKPGYVLIFEYFRKKKELVVRLEKMDV